MVNYLTWNIMVRTDMYTYIYIYGWLVKNEIKLLLLLFFKSVQEEGGSRDVIRFGLISNPTVQTWNWSVLLLTWPVTILSGFGAITGQFQNMNHLNCKRHRLLSYWIGPEPFRNRPEALKIMQINNTILSGQFKLKKLKRWRFTGQIGPEPLTGTFINSSGPVHIFLNRNQ